VCNMQYYFKLVRVATSNCYKQFCQFIILHLIRDFLKLSGSYFPEDTCLQKGLKKSYHRHNSKLATQ